MNYCGYIISGESIEADISKKGRLSAIQKLEEPVDKKELLSFLGLANYFSHFKPKYSYLTSVLYSLVKKNNIFKWTEEHRNCFNQIKYNLLYLDKLWIPDTKQPFYISCDATSRSAGSCLGQKVKGVFKPIGISGKTFSANELNYSIPEKEL